MVALEACASRRLGAIIPMAIKTVIIKVTNRWEILRLADIATPFEPFDTASTIL
jgi:hypothetical protein